MPRKEILDRIQKYIQPFRITKGEGFQLQNYDPGDTCALGGLPHSSGNHHPQVLPAGVARGTEETLYEAARYS